MDERLTRGRTAPGRLAALDALLVHRERALLARDDDAPVVDVGLGAAPWTTLELAQAVRSVRGDRAVVGVEVDPERAEAARAAAGEALEVRVGGLDALPARCLVIRAMNLLRAYPSEDAPAALHQLAAHLGPGGVLIEGTSGPEGEVLAASWIRAAATGPEREAVVLATDFSRGFAPKMFFPRVPRDLRRHPDVEALFAAWHRAWEACRADAPDDRARFVASARSLEDHVDVDPWLLARGILWWRTPPPLQDP